MPRRYDDDLDEPTSDDREISLGATSIIGIFFLLALICAACFGFGYAMRGRQTPTAPVATTPTATPEGNGQAKPSPASAEPAPAPDTTAAAPIENQPASQPAQSETAQPQTAASQPAPTLKPVSLAHESTPAPTPVATKTGTAVVQVAAVSHKQDAEFLLQALKKRGYDAAIRQVPQDKLLHVQLGPYATKKDATTMRDRLTADGYNAIVK